MPARKHNPWFQFKQFRIEQSQSGMKVTTHACLFGARIDVAGARRVLDIGAGTGLLSLMLAQRCDAEIDAVELDAGACADAARNFATSPWSQRLHLHALALQQFEPPAGCRYDCIVSNPPFFAASWRASESARNLARHDDALPLADLLNRVERWLLEQGQCWLLLPVEADQRLAHALRGSPLSAQRRIDLQAKPDKPVSRRIWMLGHGGTAGVSELQQQTLCIHDPYPQYSPACLQLLQPYYASL